MDRWESPFMPDGKSFRTGVDSGWVRHCAKRFVQQCLAADCLQPPLCCAALRLPAAAEGGRSASEYINRTPLMGNCMHPVECVAFMLIKDNHVLAEQRKYTKRV